MHKAETNASNLKKDITKKGTNEKDINEKGTIEKDIKMASAILGKIFEIDRSENIRNFKKSLNKLVDMLVFYNPTLMFYNNEQKHLFKISALFDDFLLYLFKDGIKDELPNLRAYHVILKHIIIDALGISNILHGNDKSIYLDYDFNSGLRQKFESNMELSLITYYGPEYLIKPEICNMANLGKKQEHLFSFEYDKELDLYNLSYREESIKNPVILIMALNVAYYNGIKRFRVKYEPVKAEFSQSMNEIWLKYERLLNLMCKARDYKKENKELILEAHAFFAGNCLFYTPSLAFDINKAALVRHNSIAYINDYKNKFKLDGNFIKALDDIYSNLFFNNNDLTLSAIDKCFSSIQLPIYARKRVENFISHLINQNDGIKLKKHELHKFILSEKEETAFWLCYADAVCDLIEQNIRARELEGYEIFLHNLKIIRIFIDLLNEKTTFTNLILDKIKKRHSRLELDNMMNGDFSFILKNNMVDIIPIYVEFHKGFIDFNEIKEAIKKSDRTKFMKSIIEYTAASLYIKKLIKNKSGICDNYSFVEFLVSLHDSDNNSRLKATDEFLEAIKEFANKSIFNFIELTDLIVSYKLKKFYKELRDLFLDYKGMKKFMIFVHLLNPRGIKKVLVRALYKNDLERIEQELKQSKYNQY